MKPILPPSIVIEKARNYSVVDEVKTIADAHRDELGFHSRQTFIDSISKEELFIAREAGRIVGFVRYHHRKDHLTTLYEIATSKDSRGSGVGRKLINSLFRECQEKGSRCIRLSCPVELSANEFYQKRGFRRSRLRSKPGKSRPLYEWELPVLPDRRIVFVASLTASAHDIKRLIQVWEEEGLSKRPFERCIITPLFIDPPSFELIRYMHDKWNVEVVFDSGGFFVQQGKIKYEELFSRLLEFYIEHEWADVYVLPDYVPTSRQSEGEVDERVYVTAAEGVKFLKRLPEFLRNRALGVLQGHTAQQLEHCLNAFLSHGMTRIGFGSFDTTGVNAEINILTQASVRRLEFVRDWLHNYFIKGQIATLPDLHLFGVSSPNIIREFNSLLATSFDSSGWMRTAGYGNIYLPFQGRRNVTHGGSSVLNGAGLTAAEFYSNCEKTKHSCTFCKDFKRLQKDRFARMWHNAIVFSEMSDTINNSLINLDSLTTL